MSRPIVRLGDEVIEEIASIARYIANDNLDAAMRFYDAVQRECNMLAAMPGMGSLRPVARGRLTGLRLWPVAGFRNYLILYLPHAGGGIEVVHVLHGARNLDSTL